MWNLRCGRDEAVQDDGDCQAKTRNLQNSLSVCEQKIKRVDSKPIVWQAFWRRRGRLAAKGGGMSPETTQMLNLRCGRDEAVQDDGDCQAKTRNLQNSLSVCEQKIKRETILKVSGF